MAVTTSNRTFADVLKRLGSIPAKRVRFDVKPGYATVRDLISINAKNEGISELVDGFLVEKPMGAKESFSAVEIIFWFRLYLESNDLGFVLGEAGPLKLMKRLVRIPDVSFISWEQCPGGEFPEEQVPMLYPDLAVEVISPSNTRKEIARKLRDTSKPAPRWPGSSTLRRAKWRSIPPPNSARH